MNLNELKTGQSGKIVSVGGEGALRQHFLDMGVIPGIEVRVEQLAPMGDPMELLIQGYELTLRLSEAEKIEVEPLEDANPIEQQPESRKRFKASFSRSSPKSCRLRSVDSVTPSV